MSPQVAALAIWRDQWCMKRRRDMRPARAQLARMTSPWAVLEYDTTVCWPRHSDRKTQPIDRRCDADSLSLTASGITDKPWFYGW